MNTPEPANIPPLPRPAAMQFEPMPNAPTLSALIETLLKRPGRIIYELHQRRGATLGLRLLAFALLGVALYGVVVGSLTGGTQMFVAALKIALGTLVAALICLPSLYIFLSLNGLDAPIRTVAGALLATICLSALLLIGFAPAAWVFSHSTDSIGFMGGLHLAFWLVAIGFGLRMVHALGRFAGATENGHLRVWTIVFLLVCFQMTTSLRPIMARSDKFFPSEKKFFLSYWLESLNGRTKASH